jgi:ribosome-associated protein
MNQTAPAADIPARVQYAISAAADKKAMEPKVLHLGEVTDFTEYFVILSGNSERQVTAIADAVMEQLRIQGVRPLGTEGLNQGEWALLDYGDFLVHVFTEDRRRFYNLERLWSDAPDVTARFDAVAGS